jgi:hypothetical protein
MPQVGLALTMLRRMKRNWNFRKTTVTAVQRNLTSMTWIKETNMTMTEHPRRNQQVNVFERMYEYLHLVASNVTMPVWQMSSANCQCNMTLWNL